MRRSGNSGVPEERGYSPREIQYENPTRVEGGYQPAGGRLTSPPATGSGTQNTGTEK